MRKTFTFLAAAALVLSVGSVALADEPASGQLAKLFEDSFEFELKEDPLFATSYGDRRYNDMLPSVGLADQQRRLAQDRAFLERLMAIDRAKLSRDEQINYDIFARLARDRDHRGRLSHVLDADHQSRRFSRFVPGASQTRTTRDDKGLRKLHRAVAELCQVHRRAHRAAARRGQARADVARRRAARLRKADRGRTSSTIRPAVCFISRCWNFRRPSSRPTENAWRLKLRRPSPPASCPAYRKLLEFMT